MIKKGVSAMKKFTPARVRTWFQILYTVITNGYAYGFMSGKIYKGPLKYTCVPGLNCYSCPGAVASCPLGALQNALNKRNFEVPFAVLGFFFIFGSIFGRFVCGWLCPFGLVQDLLHKIPLFKKRKQLPKHHTLKYGKYVTLVGLVLIGSAFLFKALRRFRHFVSFYARREPCLEQFRCLAPTGCCSLKLADCFSGSWQC